MAVSDALMRLAARLEARASRTGLLGACTVQDALFMVADAVAATAKEEADREWTSRMGDDL